MKEEARRRTPEGVEEEEEEEEEEEALWRPTRNEVNPLTIAHRGHCSCYSTEHSSQSKSPLLRRNDPSEHNKIPIKH